MALARRIHDPLGTCSSFEKVDFQKIPQMTKKQNKKKTCKITQHAKS